MIHIATTAAANVAAAQQWQQSLSRHLAGAHGLCCQQTTINHYLWLVPAYMFTNDRSCTRCQMNCGCSRCKVCMYILCFHTCCWSIGFVRKNTQHGKQLMYTYRASHCHAQQTTAADALQSPMRAFMLLVGSNHRYTWDLTLLLLAAGDLAFGMLWQCSQLLPLTTTLM